MASTCSILHGPTPITGTACVIIPNWCAVPYTPVTGARLLAESPEVRGLLLRSALQFATEIGVSSLHCLLPDEADTLLMQQQGMMLRQDVQFHWQNPGYRDFDTFLAELSRDKRKHIKQERRK